MNLKGLAASIVCLFAGLFVGSYGSGHSLDDESLDLLYKNAYLKGAVNQAGGYDETQFKIDSLEFKIQYINLRK